MRIVVIGDFSSRASRAAHEPQTLSQREVRALEPEDLDSYFEQLGVAIRCGGEGGAPPIEIRPRAMDELLPDWLWQHVEIFSALRSLRRRLADPATFAAAARELGADLERKPAAPDGTPADLLAASLQRTEAERVDAPLESGASFVHAILRDLVMPHVTPAPHPKRDELLAAVDAAAQAKMRALVGDPAFRRTEAAWRGLELLLRRVGTCAGLRIQVLDASREELDLALLSMDAAAGAHLARRLGQRDAESGAHGADSEAVLWIALEPFDATAREIGLLSRIGALASSAHAIFVAGVTPRFYGVAATLEPDGDPDGSFLGDAEALRAWEAIRASGAAAHLVLVAPRLLLRMPFGEKGIRGEDFAFEEIASEAHGESDLWGSGALAIALFLGEQLAEDQDLDPRATRRVEGLPFHLRTYDGESIVQPCAEAWLSDTGARRIAARGLIVLRSIRGADAIELGALRTLNGEMLELPSS